MRISMFSWLALSPVALCLTIDRHPKHTTTVTKTHTKTTTVQEPKGTWLPAKLTKNSAPKGSSQKKARWELPEKAKRHADINPEATPSAENQATVTVTKTVEATTTAYAACKDRRNYVTNVAADGYSGVDGQCDCEAYTQVNSGDANNAYECCSLCWGDSYCIGSLWSPLSSDGSGGCFWISATSCGTSQGYNYIEYLNGTKYNDDKTVSNGPCGLAWYADV